MKASCIIACIFTLFYPLANTLQAQEPTVESEASNEDFLNVEVMGTWHVNSSDTSWMCAMHEGFLKGGYVSSTLNTATKRIPINAKFSVSYKRTQTWIDPPLDEEDPDEEDPAEEEPTEKSGSLITITGGISFPFSLYFLQLGNLSVRNSIYAEGGIIIAKKPSSRLAISEIALDSFTRPVVQYGIDFKYNFGNLPLYFITDFRVSTAFFKDSNITTLEMPDLSDSSKRVTWFEINAGLGITL